MALTRRRLLQLLGVAVGVPLLGVSLWRRRRASPTESDEARQAAFAYLNLDPAALDAFETDYRRYVGRLPGRDRWPDRVRAQFLLSTDFFRFDADESRLISYVGFYAPSITPCNNPLARFDD
ncbi:MAG: hypothetical protein ACRD2Z_12460 [Thermoanaerobaculia bacterium]